MEFLRILHSLQNVARSGNTDPPPPSPSSFTFPVCCPLCKQEPSDSCFKGQSRKMERERERERKRQRERERERERERKRERKKEREKEREKKEREKVKKRERERNQLLPPHVCTVQKLFFWGGG